MGPLDLVNLTSLMQRTGGSAQVTIALIDGPVDTSHPDLADSSIHEIPGGLRGSCARASSTACMHGTFVAGILSAKRGSSAPAICPGCTLLVRPIFSEAINENGDMPSATPAELASAIVDTVKAGARVINLSAALLQPSVLRARELGQALDFAAERGVITVAAAGNQGMIGSSIITRHPWVIPVAACGSQGRPTPISNLGNSIGRRGLSAPGEGVTSLGTDGNPRTFGGTSAAAPFVTGTIALLWSEFPKASAARIKLAVTGSRSRSQAAIAPPLLDAWTAYETLARTEERAA